MKKALLAAAATLLIASCSGGSPAGSGSGSSVPADPFAAVPSGIRENAEFGACLAPAAASCAERVIQRMSEEDASACDMLVAEDSKSRCKLGLAILAAGEKGNVEPCRDLPSPSKESCVRTVLTRTVGGAETPDACYGAFGTGTAAGAEESICVTTWVRAHDGAGADKWCGKIPDADAARRCAEMAKLEAEARARFEAAAKPAPAAPAKKRR